LKTTFRMEVIKRRFNASDESGMGLVESLIAIAIVGTAITILLAGLSTGSLAVQQTDIRVTAENVARAQMEYIKAQTYESIPASYDTMAPLPEKYTFDIASSSIPGRDSDIQKITVIVSYDGESVFSLEDYKVNR